MGMSMPAWYDIASLEDINQREDRTGLHESQRYVEQLVDAEEAAGVPPGRVVVAGFSQGGAVALMMMRSARALAGVVGMSTYMPLRDEPPVVSAANAKTPLLLCHGTYDNVVAYEFGVATHNALKDLGAAVELKSYPGMAHGVSFVLFLCRVVLFRVCVLVQQTNSSLCPSDPNTTKNTKNQTRLAPRSSLPSRRLSRRACLEEHHTCMLSGDEE